MTDLPPADEIVQVRPRATGIILIVLLTMLLGGVAALLAVGDRVYFREWSHNEAWTAHVRKVDVDTEGFSAIKRLPHWYAVVNRRAQKNIYDETHSTYTFGMMVIFLSKQGEYPTWGINGSSSDTWNVEEYFVEEDGSRIQRQYAIQFDRVVVDGTEFWPENGRLLLVGPRGELTQLVFDSNAQSREELRDEMLSYIRQHGHYTD